MKKLFFGALVAVALYSCNKTAGGNKEILEASPADSTAVDTTAAPVDSTVVAPVDTTAVAN